MTPPASSILAQKVAACHFLDKANDEEAETEPQEGAGEGGDKPDETAENDADQGEEREEEDEWEVEA